MTPSAAFFPRKLSHTSPVFPKSGGGSLRSNCGDPPPLLQVFNKRKACSGLRFTSSTSSTSSSPILSHLRKTPLAEVCRALPVAISGHCQTTCPEQNGGRYAFIRDGVGRWRRWLERQVIVEDAIVIVCLIIEFDTVDNFTRVGVEAEIPISTAAPTEHRGGVQYSDSSRTQIEADDDICFGLADEGLPPPPGSKVYPRTSRHQMLNRGRMAVSFKNFQVSFVSFDILPHPTIWFERCFQNSCMRRPLWMQRGVYQVTGR